MFLGGQVVDILDWLLYDGSASWLNALDIYNMKIKISNLTAGNLAALPTWESYPYSCRYCLYWESPDEYKRLQNAKKQTLIRKKSLWVQDTKRCFGECGKLLSLKGAPIAYAQFAPPEFLPGFAVYQSAAADYDAVLLSCLYIPERRNRGRGYGTQLLESILVDLKNRGVGAVETFARKGDPHNPSGPAWFYIRNGFRIVRDDVEFPLLRIELSGI
jgi:GNAT superfamily N-acetyltransferase